MNYTQFTQNNTTQPDYQPPPHPPLQHHISTKTKAAHTHTRTSSNTTHAAT
ncbi:hypothetical protein B7P43_G14495 [Cryptotermes secundus]|uniref:Uncharacterized protein n=1 Tax=Cryptotermes secundus TaxID=105785 RepID=A0A2J7QKA3_9NEOP|nr:hypothetical protein B7P43_G14495 [Cryptotermes secundus]